MATDVSICNAASVSIGGPPIQALDNSNKASRIAAAEYPDVKRDMLIRGFWSFNQASFLANQTSSSPAYKRWAYSYGMPPNCLSVLNVVDGNTGERIEYELFGDQIYANQNSPVRILYKEDVTADRFTPAFVEAIKARMRVVLAPAITGDSGIIDRKKEEFVDVLADAQAKDAAQNRPRQLMGRASQSRLIRSRFR